MKLADYVVSYSLQINNRCLRYLAECDARGAAPADGNDLVANDAHTVYAENLLARDSRRLLSMWSLMQPAWKNMNGAVAEHVAAMQEGSRALTEASGTRSLALRLANLATEDHEAEAILKVARNLPGDVPMTWDALNDQFAADSHYWRTSLILRQLEDELIQQRIARSYRKSYRQADLLPASDSGAWLDVHSGNLYRWVQLCAHQLELLRPGLSEKGKAQLWYLDKMSDTLRTRAGLEDLQRATENVKVKKSAAKLVRRYVEQLIIKMDKRIVRLAQGCFTSKPRRMNALTQVAVEALGLGAVSFMPAVSDKAAGREKEHSNEA